MLLLLAPALAITPPDPGAVPLPSGVDLGLPFPEGVEVQVTCGYGPGCSSFHVGTDRTGSTNDYYALDLVRNVAGGGDGQDIVAAYEGEVVYADWATDGWASFGRIVLIEHDFGDGHTYTTLYAHLSAIDVQVGDLVDAKEPIGRMGGSGNYVDGWFGAHLHFSLYQDASFLGGPYGGHAVVPELIDGQGDLQQGDILQSGPSEDAPLTVTVDDLDPGFAHTGRAMEHTSGGYGPDAHFLYEPAQPVGKATSFGTWTPDIPEDGLYKVMAFIPYSSNATATMAPFTVHAHGHVEGTTQDQSIIGGDFHDLFGGRGFKMLAGQRAQVTLDNGSGDDPSTSVAFDALRFVKVGELGSAALGDACSDSIDCDGDLVCGPGTCVDDCLVGGCGAGGTCDEVTGLCDVWPGGTGTEPGTTDPGTTDPGTTDPGTDPTDGTDGTTTPAGGTRPAGTQTEPPKPEAGGCVTAGDVDPWRFVGGLLRRR